MEENNSIEHQEGKSWGRNIYELVRDFYTGQLLMKPVMKRLLGGLMVELAVLSVIYIAMGYSCDQKRKELAIKQRQAIDYRIQMIEMETDMMQTSRESNIIRLLDERGLNLSATNQPPIEL